MSRQVVLSGKRKEDKEAMKGKFTGVGVGPGDPQLLTLKALHAIQESDVVAIPVSDSGLKKPGENADPKYMHGLSDRQTSLFADRGKRGDLSAYADDQRQGETDRDS